MNNAIGIVSAIEKTPHGDSANALTTTRASTARMMIMIAVFAIMIIILAVLALVVVNALAESPWGVFSIGLTIPIALFMGFYLRYMRPGRVMEVTGVGVVLLLLAIVGGGYVDQMGLAETLTLSPEKLVISLVVYGFIASILPVWMLLTLSLIHISEPTR